MCVSRRLRHSFVPAVKAELVPGLPFKPQLICSSVSPPALNDSDTTAMVSSSPAIDELPGELFALQDTFADGLKCDGILAAQADRWEAVACMVEDRYNRGTLDSFTAGVTATVAQNVKVQGSSILSLSQICEEEVEKLGDQIDTMFWYPHHGEQPDQHQCWPT